MLHNVDFKRKFSCNSYKSKRLLLAEMTFGELPLTTERGDIYPRVHESGEFTEFCADGAYHIVPQSGVCSSARLLGAFNPYSTYDIAPDCLYDGSKVGLLIMWDKSLEVYATLAGDRAELYCQYGDALIRLGDCTYEKGMHFLFTFHGGIFIEAYFERHGVIGHVGDARIDECACLINEDVFSSTVAVMYVETEREISVRSVQNYLDCGIMQADIKPVKLENGEALVENGKIYLTYTSRFEEQMMQQIASYKLSTGELALEGALLFDCGDGAWCGDVATTLIYDRQAKKWRLWMCTFSHGHALAYGESENDIRFGINVIDITHPKAAGSVYEFGAMTHDEDPDLYYDAESGYWYISVCRMDPEIRKYRYYLFRSKHADRDYEFVSYTGDSSEVTGGSFVRYNGKTYFVFGRSFSETSKYDCCSFPSLEKLGELKANYPDGGFRGWGSVFEIPCGTRKRLLWATFDRTRGSSYNWSYGNLYFYESKSYIPKI